jgi:hypothetical protein
VKSSPIIPLHVQSSDPHYPQHVDEEASLASVSVITDTMSPAITTDPKRKKAGSKQTQKMSKNPTSHPYASSDGKRNSRANRDDNSLADSVPPNYDLLAKFALEKER